MKPNKTLDIDQLAGEFSPEIHEVVSKEDSLSTFEDYGSFRLLNLRRMVMTEGELSFHASIYILVGHHIYTYNFKEKAFRAPPRGVEKMLVELSGVYSGNQKILGGYSDEIEKLEEFLFKREVPSYFMDLWFDLKKDLAKIENYYFRNSMVYKEFLKKCEIEFKVHTDELKDIEDLLSFQVSNVATLKSRMDSIHHYYDSIKSDRTNKILLALTLISGIFLPLNLVVGFFGMNTEGLFFSHEPHATRRVVFILAGIVVIALLGATGIKAMDKYILRHLLGRYDFYKSISHRIAQLDRLTKGP